MQIYNNISNNIGFKKLHIRNKTSWDQENLRKFTENEKIKSYVNELDKNGVNLIIEPYNYIDSGNKPKNYGVLFFLKLKANIKSSSNIREILTRSYHCAIPTLLDGFNAQKALKAAMKDVEYLKSGIVKF